MHRRIQVIGMSAGLLTLAGVGAADNQGVFAQSPATPAATVSTAAATPSAYSAFVSKLASNLGIADSAKVDASIKTSLKQMVDDQLTAGNISANEATALKAEIDANKETNSLFGLDELMGGQGSASDGEANDGSVDNNGAGQGDEQNADTAGVADQQDQSQNANGTDNSQTSGNETATITP